VRRRSQAQHPVELTQPHLGQQGHSPARRREHSAAIRPPIRLPPLTDWRETCGSGRRPPGWRPVRSCAPPAGKCPRLRTATLKPPSGWVLGHDRLSDRASDRYGGYSFGRKQRLGIADLAHRTDPRLVATALGMTEEDAMHYLTDAVHYEDIVF
jgi:hypothetical protein